MNDTASHKVINYDFESHNNFHAIHAALALSMSSVKRVKSRFNLDVMLGNLTRITEGPQNHVVELPGQEWRDKLIEGIANAKCTSYQAKRQLALCGIQSHMAHEDQTLIGLYRQLTGKTFRVGLRCTKCGSSNVSVDATATWSPTKFKYELAGTHDGEFCEDCGVSRDLELYDATED